MVCGSWVKGILGVPELTDQLIKEECLTKFTIIPSLKSKNVVQVACGQYHTMCLLKNRTVYQWGEICEKIIEKPEVVKALKKKKTLRIGCGCNYSAVVTKKGGVYTWGMNGFDDRKYIGMLGQGVCDSVP